MDSHREHNALTPWKWVPADPPLLRKPVVVVAPHPPEGSRWLLSGFLIALLGVAGPLGWLLWTWRQEETAARQQALRHQHDRELQWQAGQRRQFEAIQELMRQIEAASPTVAPQSVTAQATPAQSVPVPSLPAAAPPARVKMELKSASEPPVNEGEPKQKRGLVKFLTSSIFVDSAVLTSSLLVPPSIPLTLAQSRLGRRLTGRIFRKTKAEKTVAAKIVRDVEDMPITQRRRR